MLVAWLVVVGGVLAEPPPEPRWEVALGASGLLYYAAYSAEPSLALDATARVPLRRAWGLAGGARLALAPVRGEVFVRLELAPPVGAWRPLAGLELGVGTRAHYEDGSGTIGHLARASRAELVPVYAALHTAPLRFALGDRWSLSFAELHLGTNLAPSGRYVRLQVGLLAVGVAP